MSEIKTDKIKPVDAGSTTTLGDSGDTISTSSGTTLDIQGNYSGINSINWDITPKTANFTAETNRGYFVNTTSAAITVTLPASPTAGSFIGIKDYALTAQTNNITINPNGNKIQGLTNNFLINTQGGSANLVYVDSTQGWLTFDAGQASNITEDIKFVTATGGTITTCGDFKIHSFTGPGTFCVSCGGNSAGSNSVDYLVVAGGGGGGAGPCQNYSGGGGAGGFRINTALPVSVQGYPIAVGGGGPAGTNGNNSTFSSITSTAGGAGGNGGGPVGDAGSPGGSGGGGGSSNTAPETGPTANPGGTGNTPPVSPPQGNNGGFGQHQPGVSGQQGGGGGASQTGRNGDIPHTPTSGDGGNGSPATPVFGASPKPFYGPTNGVYAGGGGGMGDNVGTGGSGGGGNGNSGCFGYGTPGTVNTGGGGGNGASGGSGIVIIRYKYQ